MIRSLEEMTLYLRSIGLLKSKIIEKALLTVDRRYFVPQNCQGFAYDEQALPVGHGQTISAPGVVSFMLEALEVKKGSKVLEIGTGSGYNTALLSYLIGKRGKLITIEKIPELTELAKNNMDSLAKHESNKRLNFENIEFLVEDGSCGHQQLAPYDRIIVTAAMPGLDNSHPLILQLAKKGKLVAPVGNRFYQDLIIYDNEYKTYKKILPVVFVPLVGKCGFSLGSLTI